jgi:putative acyl-CoA dehydrogenase
LQASVVLQASPSFVSEAFLESRIAGNWGHAFGTLPPGLQLGAIVERANPA